MVRYVQRTELDAHKWNDCIKKSPNGNIYAYSWYLDQVTDNWSGLVEGDYESVMPLVFRRKYFQDYIYPPFFTQQLGIYSSHNINSELTNQFFARIPQKFRFIEMNLNSGNTFIPSGFESKKMRNLVVDLRFDYEYLVSSYSENHKRNTRKAEKNELKLVEQADPREVVKMFRDNRGASLMNLNTTHYDIFLSLYDQVVRNCQADTWLILNRFGLPCAGAVFFEMNKTAVFIFSAVTSEGRSVSAMHKLIDEYIHRHAQRLDFLDFEGSNDDRLARFYSGFGARELVYLQVKRNKLSFPFRWFKN